MGWSLIVSSFALLMNGFYNMLFLGFMAALSISTICSFLILFYFQNCYLNSRCFPLQINESTLSTFNITSILWSSFSWQNPWKFCCQYCPFGLKYAYLFELQCFIPCQLGLLFLEYLVIVVLVYTYFWVVFEINFPSFGSSWNICRMDLLITLRI